MTYTFSFVFRFFFVCCYTIVSYPPFHFDTTSFQLQLEVWDYNWIIKSFYNSFTCFLPEISGKSSYITKLCILTWNVHAKFLSRQNFQMRHLQNKPCLRSPDTFSLSLSSLFRLFTFLRIKIGPLLKDFIRSPIKGVLRYEFPFSS